MAADDGQRCGRSWDEWWDHLEKTTYEDIRAARLMAEAAAAEKARQHAEQRAAARVRKNPSFLPLNPVSHCPREGRAPRGCVQLRVEAAKKPCFSVLKPRLRESCRGLAHLLRSIIARI